MRMHARALTSGSLRAPEDVVLVHGLVVSGRYMLPLGLRLSPAHRVFIPDLPGFGHSPAPAPVLDVAALADALVGWAAARGLRRPHLVANSFGCQVAAAAAARHPQRFASLSLIGPTMDPGARTAIHQGLRWLRAATAEPWVLNLVIARDYLDAGLRRAIGTARVSISDRIELRLAQLKVPVLIIRGSADPIVPAPWSQRAATLARGRLCVIEGSHTLNFSRAPEVAAALSEFIRATAAEHR
jgi:pimeloyl-ACP methyl ester carboxylesterase